VTKTAAESFPIAVLISGAGRNLQALIDAQQAGDLAGNIVLVISNRADAYGLTRARDAGIRSLVIDPANYPDRETYDQALMAKIDLCAARLVVLAGFMRILTAPFVQHYEGRLLNIHPSLLPLYRGLHTHQRVLAAGDAWHGASVHFVTEELDGGPAVLQGRVPVNSGDDPESLANRVMLQEVRIYPRAVDWFAKGRLQLIDGEPELDGETLIQPIMMDWQPDEAIIQ